MLLESMGWNTFFDNLFQPFKQQGYFPGRIVLEHANQYELATEFGECPSMLTGKMRFIGETEGSWPAVGDWVVITYLADEHKALIHDILPRRTKFSRKVAGDRTEEQIVAANVDVVFLVSGLDADFNLRRIERFLIVAGDSGARPVIILNKADISPDPDSKEAEVRRIAGDVPVIVTSALQGRGLDQLLTAFGPGETAALLGSSGVGKSSLVNALLDEAIQKTNDVRHFKDRGKHTTSRRQLFRLPSGGLLLDTPGMRELQLWDGQDSLEQVFQDIYDLAQSCRFRDCRHDQEPGCAVRDAIEQGTIEAKRFDNYLRMRRELKYLELKQDGMAARAEKLKWKKIHATIKKSRKKP